jgi:hypothetical protein
MLAFSQHRQRSHPGRWTATRVGGWSCTFFWTPPPAQVLCQSGFERVDQSNSPAPMQSAMSATLKTGQ